MRLKILLIFCGLSMVAACGKSTEPTESATQNAEKKPEAQAPAVNKTDGPRKLDIVLDSQPDDVKARYQFRHPNETLTFFGIEPGMTVVEALPGGGWYTKILLPLLGEEGTLVGANYDYEVWPKFGFFNDETLAKMKTWTNDWPNEVAGWGIEGTAPVKAYELSSLPAELEGTADAVLFIRALHNLARFNVDGGYLDSALATTYKVLKPGGIVGIVQHEARENMPDQWAGGQNGYLKKSFVIAKMQEAGFELIGESAMNENPLDKPTESDVVWRLPPGLYTSQDNPELREKLRKLGESNRMTLKFKKPE